MNKHKYPATLKEIKGRRSIRDYKEAMKSGSKSQPNSPLIIRRNQPSTVDDQRRLSCSMPKTTSPQSNENCSGESGEDSEEKGSDEECVHSNEFEIINEGGLSLHLEAMKAPKPETMRKNSQDFHKRESSTKKLINSFIEKQSYIILIICILLTIWLVPVSNILHNKGLDNIEKIKAQFPSQDQNFWSAIIAGLQNVLENDLERTTVFLFLNSNVKDRKTINDLSEIIAEFAANRLGTYKPIVLSPADVLALKDENGYFIHKYRPKLEKQKVLLIHNLHEIPANVAQSFHYFCDSENPIVKKSVIIFTMDIPNLPAGDSLLHVVESTLQRIWSPPLNDNVIHPLITRLTTNVVAVTPELIYYG